MKLIVRQGHANIWLQLLIQNGVKTARCVVRIPFHLFFKVCLLGRPKKQGELKLNTVFAVIWYRVQRMTLGYKGK
jgi:hypothetical protein